MPMPSRRREPEHFLDLIEQLRLGLLVDAHRSVTLHVGVTAHRTDAGAGSAEIAPQQQQIDDLLDVLRAVTMLGDAHSVADDHRFRLHVDRGRALELILLQPETRRMSFHDVRRTSSAKPSKPWVCWTMNSRSRTGAPF